VAHVFGLTLAFTLNRLFVFTAYEGRLLPAYARFFGVNLISLAVATSVSSLLFRFVFPLIQLGHDADYLAHFLGLAATALPSYLGHRFFSFANAAGAPAKDDAKTAEGATARPLSPP
jgi:putative flippase GtrA